MEAGGETYKVIPCMNSQEPWVKGLMKIIEENGELKMANG